MQSDAAKVIRTIAANIANIGGEAKWWVPIVAQSNPAERADLQPPEAPKAAPSERRNVRLCVLFAVSFLACCGVLLGVSQ